MRILHVTSEAAPYAGTGGLGEVVGALPRALAAFGHEVAVFLPLYRSARAQARKLESTGPLVKVPLGDKVISVPVWRSSPAGCTVPVYLLEHETYYNREQLYGTSHGDYKDNSERFIFLARAAMEWVLARGKPFDILHAHDWQAALVPVYLKALYRDAPAFAGTRSLLTIHNLAFQGLFWHWDMKLTGLDWSWFNWQQLEFYGKLNFLKGGIACADALSTVSPRYAREIQTHDLGCGLEGALQHRAADLHGILNGIDVGQWNPAADRLIPATYDAANLKGKATCKRALQRRCGFAEEPQTPLLGMVSRLTEQKGIDLLGWTLPEILRRPVQLVVLGSGEERFEKMLQEAAHRWKGRVSVHLKFDARLAHEIEAGADVYLMPSRYEPCGLNQMQSLRYGAVPIVHETGGLADTVVDAAPDTVARGTATGFVFRHYLPDAFVGAIGRALAAYSDAPTWRKLVLAGMAQDFSWTRSAGEYVRLYQALKDRKP